MVVTLPWSYVPTDQNPADLATRGISATEIVDCYLWWFGPSWINSPAENGSLVRPPPDPNVGCEECAIDSHNINIIQSEISQSCSDWHRLINADAVFLLDKDILMIFFIGYVVIYWLKAIQNHCFSEELSILRDGGSVPKASALLWPYFDADRLLRVDGCLENASLQLTGKHPVILGTYHITRLIVRSVHSRSLQEGLSLTVRVLFETY